MKILQTISILFVLLLGSVVPIEAAIAVVQRTSQSCASATSCTTVNFGSAVTGGNTMWVGCRYGSTGRTVTITDSASNTYPAASVTQTSGSGGGSQPTIQGYGLANITGGSSFNVTCGVSGAATRIEVIAIEVSGAASSNVVDKVASAPGNGNSLDSGATATTAQANELLIGFGATAASRTYTLGSGYSNLTDAGSAGFFASEEKTVSATGTYNATLTVGGATTNWSMAIMTLKEATSTGTPSPLPLLGFGVQ